MLAIALANMFARAVWTVLAPISLA